MGWHPLDRGGPLSDIDSHVGIFNQILPKERAPSARFPAHRDTSDVHDSISGWSLVRSFFNLRIQK
jgi:hypothetical protein